MEDDTRPLRPSRLRVAVTLLSLVLLCTLLCGMPSRSGEPGAGLVSAAVPGEPGSAVAESGASAPSWNAILPVSVVIAVAVLVGLSAFFSGSETAFFSLHRFRLRGMREDATLTGRLVASVMERPSQLLITILMGNMIVNVLIAVLLGTRVEDLLVELGGLSGSSAYLLAVGICAALLVFFGEITPKICAVKAGERFARIAVVPLKAADRILAPLRDGLLRFTDGLFTLVRFNELRAAPFITDDELKSVLNEGEAQGVIQEDERLMIQNILEFSDATLREILVPRPDIVAISQEATVAEALEEFRTHEFSRLPVYDDNIDHVTGLLVAKDLLPSFAKGALGKPVRELTRPVHFVPETMTVQQFVSDAQKHRAHMAVVVDEYGGTAGIVTLENALEQVVGDLLDEDEQEEEAYEQLRPNVYRVDGSMSLDELNDLIGTNLEDEEHETVAGFMMSLVDKVLEKGDQVDCDGVRLHVEECEGKRAAFLRVEVLKRRREGDS